MATVKFWLSFADATLPNGAQFLGACMVEVQRFEDERESIGAALRKAHAWGINPGGEVKTLELPDDAPIHESWFNVLISKETIKKHDTPEGWGQPRPQDIHDLARALAPQNIPEGLHIFPLRLDRKMSESPVGETCLRCGVKDPVGPCEWRYT